jgi:hypothetical protein
MRNPVRLYLFVVAIVCCAAVSWLDAQTPSVLRQAPRATQPAAAALAGWQADFNGDGRADLCQIVTRQGFTGLTCKISGTNTNIDSGNLDLGYPEGRAFVDFDGDGKQDYCRIVGNGFPSSYAVCTMSDGFKWGPTLPSPSLDWGYPDTRQWRDVNEDGRADFCRAIGNYREMTACTLSQGRAKEPFGRTLITKR